MLGGSLAGCRNPGFPQLNGGKSLGRPPVTVSPDTCGPVLPHPGRLILDDRGLHRLTGRQPVGLCDMGSSSTAPGFSFVITSKRAVDEWLSPFDDPILGNNRALDRLANASYQVVIEGTSYRERFSPHRNCWAQADGERRFDFPTTT